MYYDLSYIELFKIQTFIYECSFLYSMTQITLKEEINAKTLISLIWEKKEFGKRLLRNSLRDNNKDGEFEARVILDSVDFCLQKILELQARK